MFVGYACGGGVAAIAMMLSVCVFPIRSEESEQTTPPRTNLDLSQELVGSMVEEIVQRSNIAPGESINVKFVDVEDGWIGRSALVSRLKSLGNHVFAANDSTTDGNILLDVTGFNLTVRYDDMLRDGFLGAKKVRRTVSTGLVFQAINTKKSEILTAGALSRQAIDTVAVDDIAGLEHPSARGTRGELPGENFFDRIVEPFIIIGATAVVIYLFFHIRS